MPPLKLSFSTLACPNWSWYDVLRHGPAYGYAGVELRLLERETDLRQIPELHANAWPTRRRELASANFQVCGLASSIRLDEQDSAARESQLETARYYIDLAVGLGAEFIRVFGDVLPHHSRIADRHQAMEWIADGLREIGTLAAPAQVKILLETHGDFSASPPAAEIMQRTDHPNVGLVWDTHHPWRFFGETICESWDQLRPWVYHTHWKDSILQPETEAAAATAEQVAATDAAAALMAGHRHADYVLFLGGEFPSRECLQVLLDANYDGWHSLEWEKMWHPELTIPEIALPLFPKKMKLLYDSLLP